MAWPTGYQPFGPNRHPLLTGLSSTTGTTPIPVAVDPATGAVLTSGGGSSGGTQYAEGTTTTPATGNVGLGRYNSTPVTVANGALNAMAIDVNANTIVVGNVASGSTDSGSPVKLGGKYNSTLPTFTDGQRGDIQIGTKGSLATSIRPANSTVDLAFTSNSSDTIGTNATGNSIQTVPFNLLFNGTSWDRLRAANSTANTTGTGLLGVGNLGFDGTNWQSIGATVGDTGQNALVTAGGRKEVAYTTTTAQALVSTDVSNYKWVSVQIVTQGTNSVVNFQGSNDNTNWVATPLYSTENITSKSTSSNTTGIIWSGPLNFRYFRLNVTGISAGTTAGTVEFFTVAGTANGVAIFNGNANVVVGSNSATGSALPANVFAIGMQSGTNTLVPVNSSSLIGDNSANGALATANYNYNNTSVDRQRNNTSVVVVAAGSTSTTTQTVTTYNARSLVLAVNITAGAGTLTVAISGSTTSGYTYPILTSTALTGVADNTLRVFPGAIPATNTVANDALPRTLSITYTVVGSVTFGSDAVLSV